MDQNFLNRGFTDVFDVEVEKELIDLSNLIYKNTKEFLVDHDENIPLFEKLNLHFKEIPDSKIWSELMNIVNNSTELYQILNSRGVRNAFKKIFNNPKLFNISTFRARLPKQKRVLYDWHQDEGTWFVSKNEKQINKYPATLWFSINGASEKDSIQLVKYSHKKKLYNHTHVTGQGYFNIKKKEMIKDKDVNTISIKPSQGILFQPLTIHRSVPPAGDSLRPRYTIDIRYFDEEFNVKYKVDFAFKIKKFYKKFFA